MRLTRRSFLQGGAVLGGLAAGGFTLAAVGPNAACADDGSEAAASEVQYGFLVDVSKCIGCGLCVQECRRANKLAKGAPDRRIVRSVSDERGGSVHISIGCMHCAEPSCLTVCPAGAITKGDGGIVSVDKDRCIGCKYCYQACPYGVPAYDSNSMDKCDCCLGSGVAVGQRPHCVDACMFGALSYGTLDELRASTGDAARTLSDVNGPSYLVI